MDSDSGAWEFPIQEETFIIYGWSYCYANNYIYIEDHAKSFSARCPLLQVLFTVSN